MNRFARKADMRSRAMVWTAALLCVCNVRAASFDSARLDEVARRGAEVMPFALDATRHVFARTPDGGVQQVVAHDPHDARQIALIRSHLAEIAEQFSRGDFSDPIRIHGAAMPGLAALQAAKQGEIQISYANLPDGGQIVYSTRSVALQQALHDWFDAQLSDHARHAVPGHGKHTEHHRPAP